MEHSILLVSLITILSSCQDSLSTDPLSEVTAKNYFQTAQDLELYTNSFYTVFPGAAIYNGDAASDNIMEFNQPERVRGDRIVPTNGGGWSWGNLRKINYFLTHYQKADDASAQKKYSSVARFFRAHFYFQKVKRFGDVPWYSKPIDPTDEETLNKARDPRGMVIDSVMADLDYAIQNMSDATSLYRVTKWSALALKSRIGLFEGAFRKYHGMNGADKYLNISVQAAEELMDSGVYSIYSTGNPNTDYGTLFSSHDANADEMILARQYGAALQVDHRANYYTTTPSYGQPGMPKDMVNSYLMKDGSRYTDKQNYNQQAFFEEVQNRDPRLTQTIRTPGYSRIGQNQPLPPNLAHTVTGYHLIKFVTEPQYDNFDSSINDLPIFRYAEVLLNFAEAKAELGTLTQSDLDQSINQLRNRIDMPALILAQANSNPDPVLEAQYPNVDQSTNKGVVLEIRRERRIELYMENFRWDDLMRWKAGQKLTQPFRGMYFPGTGEYDLDQNGQPDLVIYEGETPSNQQNGVLYLKLGEDIVLDENGLINPHPENNPEDRAFDEDKDYLYPLPRTQLLLNSNLEQNPGWGE